MLGAVLCRDEIRDALTGACVDIVLALNKAFLQVLYSPQHYSSLHTRMVF